MEYRQPAAVGDIGEVLSGGTAVFDTAGTYGAYAELYAGDGNSFNGESPFGNIVQNTGTTVNVSNWFEIGRLFSYSGTAAARRRQQRVSTYTMNGTSVVNASNANTGAEIGWGWTNSGTLSNTTGSSRSTTRRNSMPRAS